MILERKYNDLSFIWSSEMIKNKKEREISFKSVAVAWSVESLLSYLAARVRFTA